MDMVWRVRASRCLLYSNVRFERARIQAQMISMPSSALFDGLLIACTIVTKRGVSGLWDALWGVAEDNVMY